MLRNIRERQAADSVHSKQKEQLPVTRIDWALSIKDEQPESIKIHIYNFFITEGHFQVAETFAEESGLSQKIIEAYKNSPNTNQAVTSKRLEIKQLIKGNKIDEAICKLKEYEFPEKDQKKHEEIIFSLLCLKVVNLIRDDKLKEAIATAKKEVLPLTNKKHDRITTLERVMSLIAFVDVKECHNSDLLSPNHKHTLAEEVNTFLLGKSTPESIKTILGVGKWLEKRLEAHLSFPHLNPWSPELYQQHS